MIQIFKKILFSKPIKTAAMFFAFFPPFYAPLLAPKLEKNPPPGGWSVTKAKGKIQKHFDRNEDGLLTFAERQYYLTYQRMKYPLAKKRRMRAYDADDSLMLEPAEYRLYLQDKESGKLADVYKDFKDELKSAKKENKTKEKVVRYMQKNSRE